MSTLIIISAIAVIFIISIIIIFKSRVAQNFIGSHRHQIEVVNILASISTILSLFIALGIFVYEQDQQRIIQEENKQIILENLEIEIDQNLNVIGLIEKNENIFKNSFEFTVARLGHYYLERAGDIVKSKETRIVILDTIKLIKDNNKKMDLIADRLLYSLTDEELESYAFLKKDLVDQIADNNIDIKKNLNIIKKRL